LILSDYLRQITDVTLQQVISGNSYYQTSAELAAIKEVSSYLRQKYDVEAEFTETSPWSPAKIYKVADRVIKDPDEIEEPELYFVKSPYPVFNANQVYAKGDHVFWKNHTYTCLQATKVYSHEEALQFGTTGNIPNSNIFPDNPINGRLAWQDNGAYQVAAGTLLTEDSKWTKGDNRHPQLVMFTIDIAIYHLYCRIAPKNIPEARADRYNAAVAWLRMTAKGDVAADIQRVQPSQGNRIRMGSNVKNQNSY
jgi:hypothetical protein